MIHLIRFYYQQGKESPGEGSRVDSRDRWKWGLKMRLLRLLVHMCLLILCVFGCLVLVCLFLFFHGDHAWVVDLAFLVQITSPLAVALILL